MHLNFANIKFREFPILAKLNGRENLCSRKLMSAKINVIKVTVKLIVTNSTLRGSK